MKTIFKEIIIIFTIIIVSTIITSCGKNTAVKPVKTTVGDSVTVSVSTFVGNGSKTNLDGTGTAANIAGPLWMTSDPSGNIYVTEVYGVGIHKITSQGVTTTPAQFEREPIGIAVDSKENIFVGGNNTQGFYELTSSGSAIIAITPGSYYAQAICVDGSENVYMVSQGIGNVYKASSSGATPTIYAQLPSTNLVSIVADNKGTLFVASNFAIYKVTTDGTVSLFAGAESLNAGGTNGAQASAFSGIGAIAVDANDDVYVTCPNLQQIKRVTSDGTINYLAGSSTYVAGFADGDGSKALFNYPRGIAVSSDGKTVYVADDYNNLIRKLVLK